MTRTASILALAAIAALTLSASACNDRSRGRGTRDGSIRDSAAGDGATGDSGTTPDSSVPFDTGVSPLPCPATVALGVGAPIDRGDTTGGDNVDMGTCGGGEAPEAVIEWRPGEIGSYQIDTIGSEFDTVLYVREVAGTACAGVEVACDDDGSGVDGTSLVVVEVTDPAAVFYIFIDGFGDNAGLYALNVSAAGAP